MEFATALRILDGLAGEHVSRSHPGRLDRMRALLEALGDPHKRFASIHVGGTAGKGSTATMIAAILRTAGHHVGLHTKPHLQSVTERVSIDGAQLSEERFGDLLSDIVPAFNAVERGGWGKPSYYETLVALAFECFARERVDVAVVEVGIGGTLDGTNVLTPLAAVITNVGLDHTEILGDTVEAIAADKSGIIKHGVPTISAATGTALEVIEAFAKAAGSQLHSIHDECAIIDALPPAPFVQAFGVATPVDRYDLVTPVLGDFQRQNAATALRTCEVVAAPLPFRPSDAVRAFETLALAGRMECLPGRPAVVFDVAHNVEKATALRQALEAQFPGRRFVFVIAVAEGKDAPGMIAAWAGMPAQFVFTSFEVPHRRAARAQHLSLTAESRGLVSRAVEDPIEAFNVARRVAGGDDAVVVTGSTYVVAAVREWYFRNVRETSAAGA